MLQSDFEQEGDIIEETNEWFVVLASAVVTFSMAVLIIMCACFTKRKPEVELTGISKMEVMESKKLVENGKKNEELLTISIDQNQEIASSERGNQQEIASSERGNQQEIASSERGNQQEITPEQSEQQESTPDRNPAEVSHVNYDDNTYAEIEIRADGSSMTATTINPYTEFAGPPGQTPSTSSQNLDPSVDSGYSAIQETKVCSPTRDPLDPGYSSIKQNSDGSKKIPTYSSVDKTKKANDTIPLPERNFKQKGTAEAQDFSELYAKVDKSRKSKIRVESEICLSKASSEDDKKIRPPVRSNSDGYDPGYSSVSVPDISGNVSAIVSRPPADDPDYSSIVPYSTEASQQRIPPYRSNQILPAVTRHVSDTYEEVVLNTDPQHTSAGDTAQGVATLPGNIQLRRSRQSVYEEVHNEW